MRCIVLCAALAGSLLLAGASPALAAPRVGIESADLSAWLGGVLDRILSRFLSEPTTGDDPYTKTGCEMDPWGRPVCPATVANPATPRLGRAGDPYTKNGCDMDPSGKPICPTTGGQASRRPAGAGAGRPDWSR